MRRQSSTGSHRLHRGRQRGSGCLGLSCHLPHSSSPQAWGSSLGWERVPQGRGVLLNASALENGVEHRGGELAGRSVGEMVGDPPGLGEGGLSLWVGAGTWGSPLSLDTLPFSARDGRRTGANLASSRAQSFPGCAGSCVAARRQSGKGSWPHPAMHQHLQAGPAHHLPIPESMGRAGCPHPGAGGTATHPSCSHRAEEPLPAPRQHCVSRRDPTVPAALLRHGGWRPQALAADGVPSWRLV